ncbi:AMP-binding protein [Actinopolymorpha sp. B9G3]|uniref:AMP-binding protein n=1 Tax=Actinopolymorpha sp. B9G3 TaxID=3158970 RepID=UPI0032D98654
MGAREWGSPARRGGRALHDGGTPVTNLAALVRQSAEAHPDRVALVCGARRMTWAELDAAVDAAAAALTGAGLVAGFRVALALVNSVEFVSAYFGALRAGLVAVPIDPTSGADEVSAALTSVRARMVLTDATSIAAVRTAVRDRDPAHDADPTLVVPVGTPAEAGERHYDELLASASSAPVVPPADPETLAVVLFTSGTTGAPRAVMLTHRALRANLDQIAAIEPPPMRHEDVVLGLMPLCHVYGLNGVLGMVAHAGATLVLVDRFDPAATLDLIAQEKITQLPVVPQVLASWARQEDLAGRLAGVRLVVSGAAPLAPSVRHDIEERTRLVVQEGYGLTEAAPTVTSTLCSAGAGAAAGVKPGSVGAPLPGIELRIVDDAGNDVEPGEPGEILVRGDNLFSGYWPDGAGAPGEKGWFATGDVGYLDPDGDLVLVDRLKELITVSGFSVYPREVEDVIVELDSVAEAAVVGMPDPLTGEAVKAYVVPRVGRQVTPEEVLTYCNSRLARFKRPSVVAVVDALPRSVSGTVAKARLRFVQPASEPPDPERPDMGAEAAGPDDAAHGGPASAEA